DLEGHRRALAQADEDVQQRIAVLAAGDADHHLVARLDHVEVADRLSHQAMQPLRELVGLELPPLLGPVRGGERFGKRVHAASFRRNTSTPTDWQSGYTSGFSVDTRTAFTKGCASISSATSSHSVSCRCTCPRETRCAMLRRMKS